MKSLSLTAFAAVSICLCASLAQAGSPFDALVANTSPVTLAQAPVTKLPAGDLFGSLLTPKGTSAECTCENCTCANCGCTVSTATEEEVVAAARLADQQRYVYTVADDGSFTAVPRRTTATTRTTTTYAPAVVTSAPVYSYGDCSSGMCSVPSSGYTRSYYSAATSTPYTGGRYTSWMDSSYSSGACAGGSCGTRRGPLRGLFRRR